MATKKITLENFEAEVKKILDDYGEDVNLEVKDIITIATKKGVTSLKNEALSKFKASRRLKHGRYGTGFKNKMNNTRLRTEGIIWNAKYPGLVHLLENGHAKRGGGRVEGRPHVKPVEDAIKTQVLMEVARRL